MKTNKKLGLVTALTLIIAAQPAAYGMQHINRSLDTAKQYWKPLAGTVALASVGYLLWSNYNQNTITPTLQKKESFEDLKIYKHYINLLSLINASKLHAIENYVTNDIDKNDVIAVLTYSDKNSTLLSQQAKDTLAYQTIDKIYQRYITDETKAEKPTPSTTDTYNEMGHAINEFTDIALEQLNKQETINQKQKQKAELTKEFDSMLNSQTEDLKKANVKRVDQLLELVETKEREKIVDQTLNDIEHARQNDLLEKALDTVLAKKQQVLSTFNVPKTLLLILPISKVNETIQKIDVPIQTQIENQDRSASPRAVKISMSPRYEAAVFTPTKTAQIKPGISRADMVLKIAEQIKTLILKNDLTSCVEIHETFTDLAYNKSPLIRDILKCKKQMLLKTAQGTLAHKTIIEIYKQNVTKSSL